MSHPPTESQGSEVMSHVGWAEFQGSLGGGGASDEGPNMSTRSNMADYRGSKKPLCKCAKHSQVCVTGWAEICGGECGI